MKRETLYNSLAQAMGDPKPFLNIKCDICGCTEAEGAWGIEYDKSLRKNVCQQCYNDAEIEAGLD